MGIMHCKSLMECDAYFDAVLAKSEYRQLLGSIELSSEELDHLCTHILRDTDWTYLTPVPSLSISIFLVYIGIHYYRDSYWPSVFEKLMLPEYNRHRYQEFLGKTFLCTLKKYNLLNFESGYRYVTPILVHGCVPDAYLDEFFSGVMLYIYRDRRELSLDFNETQHLLDTYRRAYQRRHKRGQYLNGLKKYEEELRIALDKTRNYSRLKRIENLQKRIVEFEELNMLLNYEEDWLDKAQAKHERMVYFYDKQLEINNIINEVKLKQARLNRDLSIVTEKLFNKQDNSLTSFIGSMPIDEILVLVKDLVRFHRYFFGFWRRQAMNKHLYRRYKRIGEMQSRIQEKIYPVKFKHQVFVQPYNLLRDLQRLKDLITDKKILENQLKQVKDSQEQVAVALEEENLVPGDISGWQKQITQLYREIVGYKMNLVRLGRGDLEFGQEVLEEQRNLRREINYQKSAIVSNYDVDTLLEKMADHEDEYNEDKILKRLRTVREHIEVNESRLNETFEPLYFLNESIRIFLFKGGDTADRFLFNLLLLMQKLDRGEEDLRSVRLPERIINAMEEWWQDKGRFILDEVYDEVEREKAQEDKIMFRRPVIKLDRLRHCIIAEIPEQRVFGSNNVVIRVANADDELHRVELPVMKSGQEFYIQACQFEIKKLLPTYKFEYVQGSITCNIEVKMWDIKRPYILFSKNGQFIDKIRSSDEGVYIV
ncbi:MAG: hypothetical protein GX854_06635, partial [Clostridiales bacterium]|nr:hypothetical protein [Clostridiales bacterium]